MSKKKFNSNNRAPNYTSAEYSSGKARAKHVNQKPYENYSARAFVRHEAAENRQHEKDLASMKATKYSSQGYGGVGSVAHSEGEKAKAAASVASAFARAIAYMEQAFYEMAAKIRVAQIKAEADIKLSSDKRKSAFMNSLSNERSSYYKAASDIKRDELKYKDNRHARKYAYKVYKKKK